MIALLPVAGFIAYSLPRQFITENSCPASGTTYADASAALFSMFNSEPEAQAVLVGYTHRDQGDQVSAPRLFAEELLPVMRQQGYSELVLEIFPVGNGKTPIDQEIDAFNRTGIIGDKMKMFLPAFDPDYRRVLEKAHSLGMTIHAGGETYSQRVKGGLIYDRGLETQKKDIACNSERVVGNLIKQNKKVVWFGGSSHNDLDPAKDKKASFGWRLEEFPFRKIVELEMVLPALSRRDGNYKALALPENCDWSSFVPRRGVSLVNNPHTPTYLLYWPN